MKNNTILKPLTEMSKDVFKVLFYPSSRKNTFLPEINLALKNSPKATFFFSLSFFFTQGPPTPHASLPDPPPQPRNQRLTNKLPFEKKFHKDILTPEILPQSLALWNFLV